MIYKSYADVARDVQDWSSQLPPFAGVCGVPRAGSLIAYLLSAHRNTQLIAFSDLKNRNETWKKPRRRNCPATDGPILVVDDTVATGGHMRQVKELLKGSPYDIKYGVYFAMSQGKEHVDYFYRDVGTEDHLFEFNVLHHPYTNQMMSDLDGVLCEDWPHDYETGDLSSKYANHLLSAKCLNRPTYAVGAIVTGRLESHREATEHWLRTNAIEYGQLIMYPANKPEDRHHVAEWKGAVYKQSNARLFIESCAVQSGVIRQVSGRDVLDWGRQKMN